MTRVTSSVDVVSRFKWHVPCDYAPGSGYTTVIGDLVAAWDMAASEAKRQGINTGCEDWAHVGPSDEEVTIFFDVETAGKPTTANDTELAKLRDTIFVRVSNEEVDQAAAELRDRLDKLETALSFADTQAAVRIVIDVINRGRTA